MSGTTKVLTFSEGVSVLAPSQSFLSASNVQAYADDAAFVAAKGSAASDSDFYYNTTLDLLRYYSNGAWSNVVDDDSVQQIINKALVDSSTELVDNVDNTKKAKFELSSITPSTTRTLTVPDTDMILSGRDNNETISGAKTFSAPVNVSNTTQSTSKDTGALIVEGGVGIEKDVYIGGNLTVKGTTTTIESTTLDVADQNITVNKGGNQASADDVAGLKVEMSDATHAQLIYDKDVTSKFRIGNVGSEKEVVTTGDSQTLTNKTMTSPVLNTPDINGGTIDDAKINLGTASNTKKIVVSKDTLANLTALTREEGSVFYDTDSDNLVVDDGTVLKAVGGAGAGGINHLSGTNIDAESTVGSWVTYKDASQVTPVDGTGGSPSVTFVRTTSSPLIDNASFLFTKPASDVRGEGFSIDFTIDSAHKCEASMIQFYMTPDTNYVDESLEVFLYDVTNSVFVSVTPSKIKKSSLTERPFFEFQFPSNSSSYRLIFHVNSTTTTGYTVRFDFFEIKPKQSSLHANVTDWITYTPTGGWTGSVSYTGKYRRVGDSMDIDITISTSGAPTGTTLFVNLPVGITIDDTRLSYTGQNNANVLGMTTLFDVGATGVYAPSAVSLSSLTALIPTYDKGDMNLGNISPTAPFTFGAGDFVRIRAWGIPILGWSSGTQIQSIFSGRQIFLDAIRSTNQTGVNPNNSLAQINLNSFNRDTTGMMNIGTYTATIPTSGEYDLVGSIAVTATNVLANQYYAAIKINGVTVFYGQSVWPTAGSAFQTQVTGKRFLNAGDTVTLFLFGAGNNSVSTLTVDGSATNTYLQISKIQAPNQTLASEKVVDIYESNAGTVYTNGNTLVYEDKVSTTHGSYNPSTGVYTCNKAGFLNIVGIIAGTVPSASAGIYIYARKNSADYKIMSENRGIASSGTMYKHFSGKFPCNQGDTFTVNIATDVSFSDLTNAFYNHIAFTLE